MNADSFTDIEFHPTSFCDGNGRVFWSGGEIYRGIPEKRAEFTRRIFADGIVNDLIAKKFIPRTTLTDASLPDYPVILHHERIPFVSYAYEWGPSMLREAGLLTVRFLRELAGHNLAMAEVASWNILFAGPEPISVDFADIIEAPDNQEALWATLAPCLQSYYLRPLELYARGQGNLARLLLTDYEHGPIQREFDAATATDRMPPTLRKAVHRYSNAIRRRVPGTADSFLFKKLAECEQQLLRFNFAPRPATVAAAENHALLARVLEERTPKSALVVGGDDATIALVARTGAPTIALDRDESRVDAIYEKARAERANILSLVVDLRYPAPGYGVQNAVLPPALTRLRCDLVVALGLIESLVFEQRLQFEQIAGTFAALTLRHLIVDFPSPKNPNVLGHLRDPYFAWFSRDHFTTALEKHFPVVRVEPSPGGGNALIVCEKTAS